MKQTVKLLTFGLVIGLILSGCEKKMAIETGKKTMPVCCGEPMEKEGCMMQMKCPHCGKTALMNAKCPHCMKMMTPDMDKKAMKCPSCGKTMDMKMKCPACGKMMKPTGQTSDMYKCNICGKIAITGGSIDTPG
jgi:predicted RNA-binding Zn-ribbon protein involved in translation (DUF1610 family)